MAKLGIGATFQQAFGALWMQRRMFAFLLPGWLAAEFTFLGAKRYFDYYLKPDAIGWMSSEIPAPSAMDWAYLFHLAAEVPHNLYGAVFVVLVMRVLLFCAPVGEGVLRSALGRSILAIFLFKMSISLFGGTLQWLGFNLSEVVAFPPWRALYSLIFVAGVSRFCFIYATAAMGRGWQWRQCWRDGGGNAVRLFMLFAIVLLPLQASRPVIDGLASQSVAGVDAGLLTAAFLRALERIVSSTILLAVVAAAFARLTGFPAAGVPGTGRTPAELAAAFD